MLAYSEVEGDMLPHLEDFLADYNRGQRERVDHVPEKTAVKDAIAVGTQPSMDSATESSHPISTAIDPELPCRPSPEAKISSNPLKRAMAISVEESRDSKAVGCLRYPAVQHQLCSRSVQTYMVLLIELSSEIKDTR